MLSPSQRAIYSALIGGYSLRFFVGMAAMIEAPKNLLLSMFSVECRTSLMRQLEPVALPLKTVLYKPEQTPPYVHFITSGMASIVTMMADGNVAEVGLVGYEGMAESLHLLGPARIQTNCFMQIGGSGLRLKFREFERLFLRDELIRGPILQFVQYQSLVLAQVAACNRLHEVEERLARWLLMTADRVVGPELRLTQEFLAQMLGSRRSTVTLVAGTLQRSGIIEYSRGHVRILNRQALEDTACECYQVSRDALDRFSHPQLAAAV